LRITTRTLYAIRALYDLAYHRGGQATQAKEIAERQGIPLRFLEQILQDLRKAGIVEARRGPRGGYALARPPGEVTMAAVLRAVRGQPEDLFGMEERPRGGTSTSRGAKPVDRSPADDVPLMVWADVSARLVEVLEGTTLQDFVVRAETTGARRARPPATMYFI
jgi:Rrf2 family protein